MKNNRRVWWMYLVGIFGFGILTIAIIYAFSSKVDPYHFFGSGDITVKPSIHPNLRFHKVYQVKKMQPSRLFLGSSRVYHGMDPDSKALMDGMSNYNMGVPACRLSEVRAFLEHANNVSDIKGIVIGLDLFAFDPRETAMNMPWDSLYRDNQRPTFATQVEDIVKASVAIGAMVDSVKTALGLDKGWDLYYENGFLVQEYLDKKVSNVGGYYNTFTYFLRSGVPASYEEFDDYFSGLDENDSPFNALRDLIAYAAAHNISIKLYISPMHAVQLFYIEKRGYKELYNKWRRELVRIVEAAAATGVEVKLWDFSGYNYVTTERIPDQNSPQLKMEFYLDASHFKPEVGDMILARMYGADTTSGFGDILSSRTIEQHFKDERLDRDRFLNDNPSQHELYLDILRDMR